MKDLGWDTLEDRRRDIRIALLYKIVHGLAPAPTDTLVKADTRTRCQHEFKFRQITAHTAAYKNSFFPRTIPTWNSLPRESVAAPRAPQTAITTTA